MQKGFVIGWVLILLVVLVTLGGGYYYWQQKNSPKSQTEVIVSPPITPNPQPSDAPASPSAETLDWKTYTNAKYSYQIDYPTDQVYGGPNTHGDDYPYFLRGCFKLYTVPKNTSLSQGMDLSAEQIKELEEIPEGQTKVYETPNWNGQDFVYKVSYKKLPSKPIDKLQWASFDVQNNWENHNLNNLYFTTKGSYFYAINMQSGNSCYEELPIKMLSSFKFTQ